MTAYVSDIIAPTKIEHRLDFGGATAEGMFEYHYNYLTYEFRDGNSEIEARAYLHTISEVSIFKGDSVDWHSDFVMRTLMFLAARFDHIKYLGPDGYCPIDHNLAEEVKKRMLLFMREAANAN